MTSVLVVLRQSQERPQLIKLVAKVLKLKAQQTFIYLTCFVRSSSVFLTVNIHRTRDVLLSVLEFVRLQSKTLPLFMKWTKGKTSKSKTCVLESQSLRQN